MPTTAEYLAAMPNPIEQMTAGSNYVNALYAQAKKAEDDQAMQAAGQQYGTGNYAGAATTLANSGNIADAQKMQAAGQAGNKAGLDYITKALPVFQKIAQLHAQEGPQAQAQAIVGAFDHIAPEAKHLTGVSDQTLMALRQSFATDPTGTLDRLQAMVPTEFKTVGDSLVGIQGNQVTPAYEGSKYMAQPAGSAIVQVGGSQGQPGAVPSAPIPPAAAGGTDLYGGNVSSAAVQQVESRGDPKAVSPAGAVGTMQTMPGTLTSPGYGIQPAQDGSPQEQTRVGEQYLAAMQQQFGNPVDALVAYNWGPGNAQKWIASGRHWAQLPRETRDYLGQVAIAQVSGRQPQLPSQAQPSGGARVVSPAQPVWRDPTPAEKAAGVWQVNNATGEKTRETAAQQTAAAPVDAAVDYFIQSGGKFPPGMRNPSASLRILEGAKAVAAKSGQKLSDIIGYGAERQANAATLTQLTSLRGKIGTYISTFDKNLDALRSVIPKGAAGSVPIINRWIQAGRKEVQGDPDVARLNTWMTAVRDEYARILSGATGGAGITDAARNEADGIISKIDSIPAMYATLDAMHAESRNRVNSLDTAISDLRGQLRSGSPTKPEAAPKPQGTPHPQGGGATVIRYDAQGNRIQ